LVFAGPDDLGRVRTLVRTFAAQAGLGDARIDDLVLATDEVVANSLRHGGGRGVLRVWQRERELVCEVADPGHFDAPLAGRERPMAERATGMGLWIANQVCDLVQVRSTPDGTVVRLHMRR
jgi:anti-sigma regulatory factor (Ser/Thr protein kinase)